MVGANTKKSIEKILEVIKEEKVTTPGRIFRKLGYNYLVIYRALLYLQKVNIVDIEVIDNYVIIKYKDNEKKANELIQAESDKK